MKELQDAVPFYDELTPEEQRALHAALEADAELAEVFSRWERLRDALRRSLDRHVPDRDLLVLYALDAEGAVELFPEERALLDAARPGLERAFQAHPGLLDVVRHIQAARADFEAVWDAHAAPDGAGDVPAGGRRSDRTSRPPVRRKTAARWGWRAGSLLAVLAFAAVLVLVSERDRHLVTIETGPDEARLITLADGSTVRLMGGSRLSYASPDKAAFNRRVRMQGQAFFEIVPGEQGFTVETPTALASVLGTSFGVQADEALTEVVLAVGKVALSPKAAPDHMVVLVPGEMSRVAAGALPATPAPVDLTEALDWTGLFIFRAAPAERIADRLGRHYGVSVTVSPDLQGQEVTGTFEQRQELGEILRAVAAALGAELHGGPDGGFVLAPRAAP